MTPASIWQLLAAIEAREPDPERDRIGMEGLAVLVAVAVRRAALAGAGS